MYGFGLPSGDMFMSKGKIMRGEIRKNGYVLCSILKGENMVGIKSLDMWPQNTDIGPD